MTALSRLTVLRAYRASINHEPGNISPRNVVTDLIKTGANYRDCLDACDREWRSGLIDYHNAITRGWLTEKGLKRLNELERRAKQKPRKSTMKEPAPCVSS